MIASTASLALACAIASIADDTQLPPERLATLAPLVHHTVSVSFDDTPCREAIEAFAEALDVPIVGRWADQRTPWGLDPDEPLTYTAEDRPALEVLDDLMALAALYEPATWQLRSGYLEVGTKERLATPAAGERRVYEIGDFGIEPHYIAPNGIPAIENHAYNPALIGVPKRPGQTQQPAWKTKPLVKVLDAIINMIEPGNWDYGQLDDEAQRRTSFEPAPSETRRVRIPRKIAQIRLIDGALVVTAPDYVHRQINGYPGLDDVPVDDDRSGSSSGATWSITVTRKEDQ